VGGPVARGTPAPAPRETTERLPSFALWFELLDARGSFVSVEVEPVAGPVVADSMERGTPAAEAGEATESWPSLPFLVEFLHVRGNFFRVEVVAGAAILAFLCLEPSPVFAGPLHGRLPLTVVFAAGSFARPANHASIWGALLLPRRPECFLSFPVAHLCLASSSHFPGGIGCCHEGTPAGNQKLDILHP